MQCPVCHDSMELVEIDDVELDFCREGCGGLWFDNFELKQVMDVEGDDSELLRDLLSQDRVDDTGRTVPLVCPRCGEGKLRRHKFSLLSDVFIDHCYSCNGMWLDAGELSAIRDCIQDAPDEDQAVKALMASNPELGASFVKRKSTNEMTSLKMEVRDNHLDPIKKSSPLGMFLEAIIRIVYRLFSNE